MERIAADPLKRKRHDKPVTGRYTRHAAFAVRLFYRWLTESDTYQRLLDPLIPSNFKRPGGCLDFFRNRNSRVTI